MPQEPWNNSPDDSIFRGKAQRFEEMILPHLTPAYNLARWLTGSEADAQDVVQEAYLRAWHSFDTFRSDGRPRPWLLEIVRNACFTWLKKNRPHEMAARFEDETDDPVAPSLDPETALIRLTNAENLRQVIGTMRVEFREVLILRELEELPYRSIAKIVGVPVGTVMSRLSRARKDLQNRLRKSTIVIRNE